jgi:hypothetical protein
MNRRGLVSVAQDHPRYRDHHERPKATMMVLM